MTSIIIKTKNLPKETNFNRSGLVPYFIENNKIIFIFALDSKHGELTDMGGRVEDYEDFVDAAIRELNEESIGIFNFKDKKDVIVNNSISIYNTEMIIIFQKLEKFDTNELLKNYRDNFRDFLYNGNSPNKLENSFLLWIDETNLCKLLNSEYFIEDKKYPKYISSDISLPQCISSYMTKNMYRQINTYPHIYSRVESLLKDNCNQLYNILKM